MGVAESMANSLRGDGAPAAEVRVAGREISAAVVEQFQTLELGSKRVFRQTGERQPCGVPGQKDRRIAGLVEQILGEVQAWCELWAMVVSAWRPPCG